MTEAKHDEGKAQLSLVPTNIFYAIARVREFGVQKYHEPENWRTVEPIQYVNAAYRHWLAYADDPLSVDEESGLNHLWHVACNIAFLLEFQGKGEVK